MQLADADLELVEEGVELTLIEPLGRHALQGALEPPGDAQRRLVARQLLQALAQRFQTVTDRARKGRMLKQEAQHRIALHPHLFTAPIGLIAGERLEHADPLDGLERPQFRGLLGQQIGRAHVDEARGHVGALDETPQVQEVVALIVQHGPGEHAGHGLYALDETLEIGMAPALGQPLGQIVTGMEIEFVEQLPGLARHEVADGAAVLARRAQGREDGAGVALVADQEAHHLALAIVLVMLLEQRIGARDVDQRTPAGGDAARQVEQEIGIDADDARRVLRALDIARQPVDVFSDTRQHGSDSLSLWCNPAGSRCPCSRRPAMS